MTLEDAAQLAADLMNEHLSYRHRGWKFKFSRAVKRLGSCSYGRKEITLSKQFTLDNNEEEVRDVILHEIAHILAPHDGHDFRWRTMAKKIGARPIRLNRTATIKYKYVATCPVCKKKIGMMRKTKFRKACADCYFVHREKAELTFNEVDYVSSTCV